MWYVTLCDTDIQIWIIMRSYYSLCQQKIFVWVNTPAGQPAMMRHYFTMFGWRNSTWTNSTRYPVACSCSKENVRACEGCWRWERSEKSLFDQHNITYFIFSLSTYTRTYIGTKTYIHTYAVRTHVRSHMGTRTYTRTFTRTHTYVHMYVHTCVRMYTCTFTRAYPCTHILVYTCPGIYTEIIYETSKFAKIYTSNKSCSCVALLKEALLSKASATSYPFQVPRGRIPVDHEPCEPLCLSLSTGCHLQSPNCQEHSVSCLEKKPPNAMLFLSISSFPALLWYFSLVVLRWRQNNSAGTSVPSEDASWGKQACKEISCTLFRQSCLLRLRMFVLSLWKYLTVPVSKLLGASLSYYIIVNGPDSRHHKGQPAWSKKAESPTQSVGILGGGGGS